VESNIFQLTAALAREILRSATKSFH